MKVGIAGALVLGEGLMGVGPSRFTRAALAPNPTVPVMVKVMARDIQRSGSILHHCVEVWCWGGRRESRLRVWVVLAAVSLDSGNALCDHDGPGLNLFVVE